MNVAKPVLVDDVCWIKNGTNDDGNGLKRKQPDDTIIDDSLEGDDSHKKAKMDPFFFSHGSTEAFVEATVGDSQPRQAL